MLKIKFFIFYGMLLVVSLCIYITGAKKVEGFREEMDPMQYVSALMVKPEVLEIVSGEFRSIMADYLLLKGSAFMGGRSRDTPDDHMQVVAALFKQSMYLDPYFLQTGYFTQAFLTWQGKMAAEANELLKIQNEYRDWDWQASFNIGFNNFYFLKQYDEAAKYLMIAAKRPGGPPIAAILASRMALRSGQTQTAIAFLRSMHDKALDEETRKYFEIRLKAHIAVFVLEQAIEKYRIQFGSLPGTLTELVDKGIIDDIPENPTENAFVYESDTGRVFFDNVR